MNTSMRGESLTEAHAELLFGHVVDPSLYAYIPGSPPATPAELAKQYRRLCAGSPDESQIWLNWVALHEAEPVGTLQATIFADSSATIAYVIFREFWGRHLGTRGCRWLLGELFERRGVTFARAYVDVRNTASIGVALAAGLEPLDPTTERDVPPGDRVFGLSAAAWRARSR